MGEQDLQAQMLIVLGMDLEDVMEMEMVVLEEARELVEEMAEELEEGEEMEVLVQQGWAEGRVQGAEGRVQRAEVRVQGALHSHDATELMLQG